MPFLRAPDGRAKNVGEIGRKIRIDSRNPLNSLVYREQSGLEDLVKQLVGKVAISDL